MARSRCINAVLAWQLVNSLTAQVYTPSGRRMLPGIRLGAPPAFLAADGADDGARLLAVAADGSLRLWDLRRTMLELEASVEPLLAGLALGTTGAHHFQAEPLFARSLGSARLRLTASI